MPSKSPRRALPASPGWDLHCHDGPRGGHALQIDPVFSLTSHCCIAQKANLKMTKELHYIHIGKCGGKTLLNAVNSSEALAARYQTIKRTHIKVPKFNRHYDYLIVLRNPISRSISAFNWRYHLVVDTEEQKTRFRNEYDILKRYQSLNTLAEQLYTDGVSDPRAAKDFRTIHHLREDITFYLDNLLKKVNAAQILPVMAQETLDQDMAEILGVPEVDDVHRHSNQVSGEKLTLSPEAERNLRAFLAKDYLCITQLWCMGKIPDEKYAALMGRRHA